MQMHDPYEYMVWLDDGHKYACYPLHPDDSLERFTYVLRMIALEFVAVGGHMDKATWKCRRMTLAPV